MMSEPFDPSRRDAPVDELPVATTAAPVPHTMSAFLPIVMIGLVLLAWFVFQATQLRAERDAIRDATVGQDRSVDEAKKLRDSFYAIAHGAEQLADAGNPSARLIVDGLKQRGITITPNPPPGGSEPAPAPAK